MKLPITLGQSKEKRELFLSLVLKNEKVISVIFEKIGNTIKYVSSAEEEFKSTIEDAELEEFLDVLDKAITQAETALPENIETHKTILAVKDNWIEKDNIKPAYKDKLKKAADELSLEFIGFLGATESIINLIQKEEGAPATAILADLGKRNITVSLLKAGRIVETKTSEIHQSAPYTVDTLLKHFQTPEVMPTRVILLGAENDDITQEFLGHPWSKSLPFLHLPQITSLEEDASVKAMLLGATTQMGANLVYDSSSVNIADADAPVKQNKKATPDNFEEAVDNTPESSKAAGEIGKSTLDLVGAEKAAEVFGFTEGADVAKNPLPKNFEPKINPPQRAEKIQEAIEDVGALEEAKTPTTVNAALVTTQIKNFIPKFLESFKKIKFNGRVLKTLNLGGNKFLLIPLALIVLLIIVTFIYLSGAKAAIDISVSSKGADKIQEVTFSSLSSTDLENDIIAAKFAQVSEDGSVTLPATGKKDVGNAAKGAVTVFNNDNQSVSFDSGTKIKSSNGLEFTLDKQVNVASASGDIFSGTTPGTATVNVTAVDIGQEGNLPSGTKFSIGSNSSVAAKNDNAFSGGSKKQVTVVSKDDIQKLLDALPKQLEGKAKDDIKSKVESDRTILNNFVSEEVSSSEFDKKADQEANQVTLKGAVDFKAISYKNSDILILARKLFDSSDLLVSKDNFEVNAKNLKVLKNKDVTSDLNIKVKLLPKIDTTALISEIKGFEIQKAKNLILNLPQVQSVDIIVKPSLPFISKNLPGDPKNINIKVTSN